MRTAIVTGAAGLVGSEAVKFFASKGLHVVGIDNDLRRTFFGDNASTDWRRQQLIAGVPNYIHHNIDVRERDAMERVFSDHSSDIAVVVHAAAQPSHDWARNDPMTDFTVNAVGTLVLLEATRKHCPEAVFIFTSTNKVYGDNPNLLPLVEKETRWEVEDNHPFAQHGIDESMSLDQTLHSVFGASKTAADVMVQEYGRTFGMKTVCFRCGCLTGPGHSGAMLHGFLSYLVQCAVTGKEYNILGYKGKQVRDNLHAFDLVTMFWHYLQNPRPGEVYNAGGGRHSNCSILEAVKICGELMGKLMKTRYVAENRLGDHIWYISDVRKFRGHYPDWSNRYDLRGIIEEILGEMSRRGPTANS